jgi:hypothetical protein
MQNRCCRVLRAHKVGAASRVQWLGYCVLQGHGGELGGVDVVEPTAVSEYLRAEQLFEAWFDARDANDVQSVENGLDHRVVAPHADDGVMRRPQAWHVWVVRNMPMSFFGW